MTVDSFGSEFPSIVMEQIRDAVWVVDEQGGIVAVNSATEAIYGFARSELTNMRVHDLRAPEAAALIDEQLKQAQTEGVLFRTRHRRRSGDSFPVEVSSRRFHYDERKLVVSVIRDISDRVLLESSLHREHEDLLAAHEELLASEEEIRQQLDELLQKEDKIERQNTVLMLVNQMAMQLMRRSELAEMMDAVIRGATALLNTEHGFVSLVDEQEQVFVRKASLGAFARGVPIRLPVTEGILGQVYRSGDLFIVADYSQWEGRVVTLQNQELHCIVVVPLKIENRMIGAFTVAFNEPGRIPSEDDLLLLRRIGEAASVAVDNALLHEARHQELLARKQAEEAVRRLAYTDSLTDLPNRAMLIEYLKDEMERTRTDDLGGTVFFLDIDDLKNVNDTFGHSLGDKIIARIGVELADELGRDAMVARIGADEFVAVLPQLVEQGEVEGLATRMRRRICRDYDLGQCVLHISASMGIAMYPRDGKTVEELFQNVDMAMYEAKRQGKSTWRYFGEDLRKSVFETMLLKQGLREAIQRDELRLVFQPVVDIVSCKIIGFESLVRWRNEEFGPIPPSRFIPLAEESGAIQAIGGWVLRAACEFAGRLRELGKGNIRVNVNISPRQLAAEDFISTVMHFTRAAEIEPAQLVLEITETALISSMEKCVGKLSQLRSAGFTLALDDFGSGYSSLSYLQNLPVNTVKIDKSFIDAVAVDPMQRRFVHSIIHMAHGQNLRVTAEGVETPEQLQALRECQCDYIQGYIYSEPIPDEAAIALLQTGFPAVATDYPDGE
jgi:diguanylate cyclase (GGDEF)-like protein/PAS domain S-box-containing protein